MEIKKLSYEKVWTNPSDFPTYQPDESQVRQDQQYHPDAIKDYINGELVPVLQNLRDDSEAEAEHIQDTDIHVTLEEKSEWGGKIWVAAAPPEQTSALWVDTADSGIAKYYNGSAWTAIGAVASAVVPKLDVLTQDPTSTTIGQVWVLDGSQPVLRVRLRYGIGSIPLSLN